MKTIVFATAAFETFRDIVGLCPALARLDASLTRRCGGAPSRLAYPSIPRDNSYLPELGAGLGCRRRGRRR